MIEGGYFFSVSKELRCVAKEDGRTTKACTDFKLVPQNGLVWLMKAIFMEASLDLSVTQIFVFGCCG